jgi:hypothetical protein
MELRLRRLTGAEQNADLIALQGADGDFYTLEIFEEIPGHWVPVPITDDED